MGFGDAPDDVVEGSDAGAACGCSTCNVTTTPSCPSGPIPVSFDTAGSGPGQCGTTANPSPLKNTPPGACDTDLFTGDYSRDDVQYTAPPPTGGMCTSDGVASFASEDRVCMSTGAGSTMCTGSVCAPNVASPYEACIEAPGEVACPSGPMRVQHVVGTRTKVTCPPCACTVTSTCSGTITLFTDGNCTMGARSIPTGECVAISGNGTGTGNGMPGIASYKGYQYAAGEPKDVACQVGDAGTAQGGALSTLETVCCPN